MAYGEGIYLTWWKGKRQYATQDSVQAYGGYYTQEEIREVVAYAASKYVTVIPEIEMPGHSEEVLAVFPRLGVPENLIGTGSCASAMRKLSGLWRMF